MKPAENRTGTPYCVRPARYGNIEKAERVNFCSCVAVVVTIAVEQSGRSKDKRFVKPT